MENKYTLRYTGGLVPDVYQYVPSPQKTYAHTYTHLNPVPHQKTKIFIEEMDIFANPTSVN
jgi:hypothetical protein